MSTLLITTNRNQNVLAASIRHEGIRVGEIIAYRAWRVFGPGWLRRRDDLLHSILMSDYVWHPDEPASGDVREHGIYSFRKVIRSMAEYGYDSAIRGPILFGKIKIWGEIVEHEAGYRSELSRPQLRRAAEISVEHLQHEHDHDPAR